jgi:hypothetical protein
MMRGYAARNRLHGNLCFASQSALRVVSDDDGVQRRELTLYC